MNTLNGYRNFRLKLSRHFGTIGMPLGDGAHGVGDVPLDVSQGKPRF